MYRVNLPRIGHPIARGTATTHLQDTKEPWTMSKSGQIISLSHLGIITTVSENHLFLVPSGIWMYFNVFFCFVLFFKQKRCLVCPSQHYVFIQCNTEERYSSHFKQLDTNFLVFFVAAGTHWRYFHSFLRGKVIWVMNGINDEFKRQVKVTLYMQISHKNTTRMRAHYQNSTPSNSNVAQ